MPQPTNQQSLTPMQQQQQAPTQPQQSAHPGYAGMFFDEVALGHHGTPKESVKPTVVKDSQHNVVNTAGMQMPHPHPYGVPQQHTQQTAPAQPTYKQPQSASSQSKFTIPLPYNRYYYRCSVPISKIVMQAIKLRKSRKFETFNCFYQELSSEIFHISKLNFHALRLIHR